MFDKPYTFDRVVRILFTIAVIFGIIWILDYLSDVLLPFVVALIIAYMMNPFVNLVQRFVKSRIAAVLLSISIVIGIIIGIFAIVIPMISQEISTMGHMLNKLMNEQDIAAQLAAYLPEKLSHDIQDFLVSKDWQALFDSEEVNQYMSMVWQKVAPHLGSIFSSTISLIVGTLSIAIVLLYLVFLLKDYNKVLEEWKNLLPPKYKKQILEFLKNFESAMNSYFRAQAAIASIVGVLFAIGFSITGLPLGILLGLFIGLLNMVPYLQNIAMIPAIFLATIQALETGQNFWVVIAMTLSVFAIVQLIQDTILTPKIMGDATGLNPVVILLSLSIWGKILGILGLLLALPLSNLILTYYKTFITKNVSNTAGDKLPGFIKIPSHKANRKIPV